MPKLARRGVIYGMADPRSVFSEELIEVRYIGATVQPLRTRLLQHLRDAKIGKNDHRCKWIRKLLRENTVPEIFILAETWESKLPALEISWIADMRQVYNLTNTTDGGEKILGVTGVVLTEEGRKKISERVRECRLNDIANGRVFEMHSKESQEKAKAKLRGMKHTDTSKANFSKGATKRFTDPKEREKISKATKGLKKSDEHKRKLAEATRSYYHKLPDVECPICGMIGKPGIVAMHRKNKGH